MEREELAGRIQVIGFSCIRCGECCRDTEEDTGLVMVFPAEIEELSVATGLKAEDFSRPYPEKVRTPGGGSITFERCLKQIAGGCIFLDHTRCMAYAARPWICRTYPFMLSGDRVVVSPCRGIGQDMAEHGALEMADLLLARRAAEQAEEERVRGILSSHPFPAGEDVLVDGTGVRVL